MNGDLPLELLDTDDLSLLEVPTSAPGPAGRLPLSDALLRQGASGDHFGMSQDVGMGWPAEKVAGPQFVLLSTLGGLRGDDGRVWALGYHTGHWELGLAVRAAAEQLAQLGGVPYAAHCSDPCDGRTQGTVGMFDSLAYRNDAAAVFARLARSIPRARGVPEVMLHLRSLGLLDLDAPTLPGLPLGRVLDWWEHSKRRARLRALLAERDGVDPDEVILSPRRAAEMGLTPTACFPRGNLAPGGSCVKSTAIDRRLLDADGVYRKTGPAKVFCREADAIAAIKGNGPRRVEPGDVLVLMGRGPMGSGMEEVFQLTAALRYLSWGREVALVTDARFSGVSTGPCIGLVTPEASAGGPLGRLRDGDQVRIVIDTRRLTGSVDLVGTPHGPLSPAEAQALLAARTAYPDLSPDEQLPRETRLWAAMQHASGGPWGGCVYDIDEIVARLSGTANRRG